MDQIQVTDAQLGLLWHTLGLHPKCRASSRNYFLTTPGYDDANNLDVLVDAGLMTRGKAPAFCDPGDVVYRSTSEGKWFALSKLPPPLPPRKITRFDAYLDVSECYDSFAHFLGIKRPVYQRRREAGRLEYRMVRYKNWNVSRFGSMEYLVLCEPVEVAGEWCSLKRDAKTSYKSALKAIRPRRKEYDEAIACFCGD